MTRLLIVAVALRVVAVAGLFALTDHSTVPFGSFFGDEEYFIKRGLWLRNLALGIPLQGLDLRVCVPGRQRLEPSVSARADSDARRAGAVRRCTSSAFCSIVLAVVLLYRLVRTTLGRTPALLGLTALLFLPSLFAWSVSALKEPLFVLRQRAEPRPRRQAGAGLVVGSRVLTLAVPSGRWRRFSTPSDRAAPR